MKRLYWYVGWLLAMLPAAAQPADPGCNACREVVPVGFASVAGDGFAGPVTGGGNLLLTANVVSIKGPAEFQRLVYLLYDRIKAYKYKADNGTARYAPLIVILEEGIYPEAGEVPNSGSVWGNSMLSVEEQGDLTIIGRGEVILHFGINVKRSRNILLRNLTFQDYYDDGINIGEEETHHVWVDHCTFGHPSVRPENKDHPDGGVDIKNGTSYNTVSWCLFRNSWKTGLVGHSDKNGDTDTGRLKTTFYMNHYQNTHSRHPRVRFGEVHVLNNYYEGITGYGIAAANGALVVAEGNVFVNTVWPLYADRSKTDFTALFGNWESQTGNLPAAGLRQFNNIYDDSGLTQVFTSGDINPAMLNPGNKSIRFDELNPGSVFNPADYYPYTPAGASMVPSLAGNCAGAGKVDFFTDLSSAENSPHLPVKSLLRVFPNPAGSRFSVETTQPGRLTLLGLAGTIVAEAFAELGIHAFSTEELHLPGGIYIILFQTGATRHQERLTVVIPE